MGLAGRGEGLSTGDGFAGTWSGESGAIPGERNGGLVDACNVKRALAVTNFWWIVMLVL